jgi:hypothetical protein
MNYDSRQKKVAKPYAIVAKVKESIYFLTWNPMHMYKRHKEGKSIVLKKP